jgi:hypothetical protein
MSLSWHEGAPSTALRKVCRPADIRRRPRRTQKRMVSGMPASEFPDRGILWRGWTEETLRLIAEKQMPVLLFVADPNSPVWPFLREIFKEMPKNAKLQQLLHETYPALYIEADALPDELKLLGAGTTYHIAILSPYGLTPMATMDPITGKPSDVVNKVVAILERLVVTWR